MNGITIQNAEKQQNLFEWSQRVADCRCSGLPVKRWCSEHGINLKTYYNWQSKVFAAMIEQQKTSVEVTETKSRFAEFPAPIRLTVQTSAKDTDLRKGIDGLAMLIRQEFDMDSFTNTL